LSGGILKGAIVTGANGFLGHMLAVRLAGAGVPTVAMSRRDGSRGFEPSRSVVGPLDSPDVWEQVARSLSSLDRCAIFHAAGLNSREGAQADPLGAVQANIGLTAAVLEGARRLGVPRVVFLSTGLLYHRDGRSRYAESDPVRPASMYATTKAAGELLVKGYADTFGLSCVLARLSNVYGTGSSPESIAGRLFGQAAQGGPLRVRSATPIRDFIFVEDATAGIIAAAGAEHVPPVWTVNVSSGEGVSVGSFAEVVRRVTGLGDPVIEDQPGGGVDSLVLSNELIRTTTGWRPLFDLESGIRRTWATFPGRTS